MNIILIADESAGLQTFKMVHRGAHDLLAVVTPMETGNTFSKLANLAKTEGYPVWDASGVQDPSLAEWIRDHEVDLLLNIHALYIIADDVLLAPRIGSFNLHPGPLPHFSGLNAPSWAIFEEQKHHRVTLHWMTSSIDAGDIAYDQQFPLRSSDTGLSVSARCVQLGLPLLSKLLKDASHDPSQIPKIPQNLNERRFYYRRQKPWNGHIRWDYPASKIDAMVRSYDYRPFSSEWGVVKSTLNGVTIDVLQTKVLPEVSNLPPGTIERVEGHQLVVATTKQQLLISQYRISASQDSRNIFKPGMQFATPKMV